MRGRRLPRLLHLAKCFQVRFVTQTSRLIVNKHRKKNVGEEIFTPIALGDMPSGEICNYKPHD